MFLLLDQQRRPLWSPLFIFNFHSCSLQKAIESYYVRSTCEEELWEGFVSELGAFTFAS